MGTQRIRARVESLLGRARARSRLLDHLVRALAHYGSVLGTQLAAAATYFGFLSFFPLVALAFAVLGFVVAYVPDAEHAATTALSSIFPGMIGTGPGKIDVHAIARRKADVGILGLLVLLYSGLGWVSALRVALQAVFEVVSERKRSFLVGRLFDLLVLAVVGVVLISSVGLGAAVTGFTGTVVRLLGLTGVPGAGLALVVASIAVGIGVNSLIFLALYRLLPKHRVPTRVLWQGALLGGVGFEILKQAASLVIGTVTRNPLYGTFAIMIALLIWINYFDRLAVLGAAWSAVASIPEPAPAAATERARRQPPADPTERGTGTDGSPRALRSVLSRLAGLVGVAVVAWRANQRRKRGAGR